MVGIYYAGAVVAFLLTGGAIWQFRNKQEKISTLFKVIALVFTAVFIARYLGGIFEIRYTVGLNIQSPFGENGGFKAALSVVVLWVWFASVILLQTYPFYKGKVKCLDALSKYFAAASCLLSLVTLPVVVVAMDGQAALTYFDWRCLVYGAELGVGAAFIAGIWYFDRQIVYPKSQIKSILLSLGGMLLCAMPYYLFQVMFGQGPKNVVFDDLNLWHRLVVYFGFIVPVIIYFIFRKYEYAQRRYALLFIALGTMMGYCYKYSFVTLLDLAEWPFHLCNTAMFIVPLCLLFKWDKLYYFTLFINVLGALFAMLMPNTADPIFMASNFAFWINHYCAFFMPLLLMALRIYKRPKLRQFIYSLIAFAVYYALMLFLNAWYSNIKEVDFFFINSNFVAEKLGLWAEKLRDVTFTVKIGKYPCTFYPVYQALYFLVYVLMSFAVWFVYEQFFEVADLYVEIGERRRKINADKVALMSRLDGRSEDQPMELDYVNKLVLKDFGKKYATSDVYAVRHANLTIEGGQIFGFLGPNGAGKSTIIKSIVGIQTITEGSIFINGYDVDKQSVFAKRQTGFVPDHYALYENLTGREYVNYIADLYEVPQKERTERIEDMVERFNLNVAFDNKIKTYSHGMKQKITIMSALVHNPKLWILDEPLTGLDPESIFQVKECMKKHAAEGNIVFFSSHIIDVVERICDRIAIIKKGEIKCVKTIKEIEDGGVALEDFYMQMIGEVKHD